MLSVIEINDIDEFFELRHEWNKVLERSRDNHIYLTWDFLSTYWKHFGKERKLRIIVIKDKNEIIAIAPLRQSRFNFANSFSYDVVEPLGYRGADYTGLILTERDAECLKLFLNHLAEHGDWDFLYLYDVPGTSVVPKLLTKISEVIPFKFDFIQGVVCPYISLPHSMDVFMNKLDGKFRKNLRRCMKNLQKDYHRVELKRYDEFGSVEETMQLFFDLHQKRWKLKDMPGVFNTEKTRNYSIDVAKCFANNGWLALYFLTADDKPIAVQYCLEYNQKMLYGLGGFDPDYSQYSAGNIILAKVIEKCIEREVKEYDLMKGGERYKFDWSEKYRRNIGIRFINRKPMSNLYDCGMKTVKQLKMDKILGKFLDF